MKTYRIKNNSTGQWFAGFSSYPRVSNPSPTWTAAVGIAVTYTEEQLARLSAGRQGKRLLVVATPVSI